MPKKGRKEDASTTEEDEPDKPKKPPCSHSFCNEPSDPSYYPKGLPWASGKLKCLPGYCKKRRPGDEDKSDEEGGEEKEPQEETVRGLFSQFYEPKPKKKRKKKCKCKHCVDKRKMKKMQKKKKSVYDPSYTFQENLCSGDPEVETELLFFIRAIMLADQMDLVAEQRAEKKREMAKKAKEKRKQKASEKKEKDEQKRKLADEKKVKDKQKREEQQKEKQRKEEERKKAKQMKNEEGGEKKDKKGINFPEDKSELQKEKSFDTQKKILETSSSTDTKGE